MQISKRVVGAIVVVPQTWVILFVHLFFSTSVVTVNFNEDGYSVAESAGQVSVSLRINGQFFVPVWAIVEISDGTATGG